MTKEGNLYLIFNWETLGLPRWLSGKESTCQCRRCRRHGFDPCIGKIPWKRAWQATPVFLPGKSHGQRSLAGYSPWGRKELDTTEHACKKGDSESSKKKILGKQRRIIIFSPGEKYKGKELKCRMKN